eukprot:scaffold86519_cov63-Phaeocystis_antarctica.AAC.1
MTMHGVGSKQAPNRRITLGWRTRVSARTSRRTICSMERCAPGVILCSSCNNPTVCRRLGSTRS